MEFRGNGTGWTTLLSNQVYEKGCEDLYFLQSLAEMISCKHFTLSKSKY